MPLSVIRKVLLLLLVACFSGSIFLNVRYYQAQQTMISRVHQQATKIRQTKKQLSGVKEELINAQTKQEVAETNLNNDNGYASIYSEYQDALERVFDDLYNFTPDDFKDRQAKVKEEMTVDLYESFFNTNSQYGDSNTVTSELVSIDCYNKSIQDTTLKGLVVVVYQSNVEGAEAIKSRAVYQVTYDTTQKKVSELTLVMTGISGDLLE